MYQTPSRAGTPRVACDLSHEGSDNTLDHFGCAILSWSVPVCLFIFTGECKATVSTTPTVPHVDLPIVGYDNMLASVVRCCGTRCDVYCSHDVFCCRAVALPHKRSHKSPHRRPFDQRLSDDVRHRLGLEFKIHTERQ